MSHNEALTRCLDACVFSVQNMPQQLLCTLHVQGQNCHRQIQSNDTRPTVKRSLAPFFPAAGAVRAGFDNSPEAEWVIDIACFLLA